MCVRALSLHSVVLSAEEVKYSKAFTSFATMFTGSVFLRSDTRNVTASGR